MNVEKRIAMERRLVRKLVRIMKENGWIAARVSDGEESVRVSGEEAVLAVVFSVDESAIRFEKDGKAHWVSIVLGNDGYDAVADYSYSHRDPDGFVAIMEGPFEAYRAKLEEEVVG